MLGFKQFLKNSNVGGLPRGWRRAAPWCTGKFFVVTISGMKI